MKYGDRDDDQPRIRRERKFNVRRRILDLYGRRCSNCGYNKDERVLQLDHLDSNPRLIKGALGGYPRAGTHLYSAILSGAVSDTLFQILCANCNFLKKLITPSENSSRLIPREYDEIADKNSEIVESEIIGLETTIQGVFRV